jgi:hypothetical protein
MAGIELLRAIGLVRLSREARPRSTSFHSEVAQPLASRCGALCQLQMPKGIIPLLEESGLWLCFAPP